MILTADPIWNLSTVRAQDRSTGFRSAHIYQALTRPKRTHHVVSPGKRLPSSRRLSPIPLICTTCPSTLIICFFPIREFLMVARGTGPGTQQVLRICLLNWVKHSERHFLSRDLPDLESKLVPCDPSLAQGVQVFVAPSPLLEYWVASVRAENALVVTLQASTEPGV